MFAFCFECFKPWIAIDGDGLAVAFAAFAVAIPRSAGGTDVIRIGNGIEYADRRGWRLLPFALVVTPMHARHSESAYVFLRTLRFVSDPAPPRFLSRSRHLAV